MKLEWPQLTYLGILFITIGMSLEDHGKPKTGNHNIFGFLIGASITLTLLHFGGFFG